MNRLTMNAVRVGLLLSGAAALMYQVVWQRIPATIVIASFRAGRPSKGYALPLEA